MTRIFNALFAALVILTLVRCGGDVPVDYAAADADVTTTSEAVVVNNYCNAYPNAQCIYSTFSDYNVNPKPGFIEFCLWADPGVPPQQCWNMDCRSTAVGFNSAGTYRYTLVDDLGYWGYYPWPNLQPYYNDHVFYFAVGANTQMTVWADVGRAGASYSIGGTFNSPAASKVWNSGFGISAFACSTSAP